MIRCFAKPPAWSDDEIRLDYEESHHLLHVLRKSIGGRVLAFDGTGREALAEIFLVSGDTVILKALEQTERLRPDTQLILAQSLLKGGKMDLIVQKATELGVTAIIPMETEHTVVHLRGAQREKRRQRWEKIARNAAKQCGNPWLPEIEPVSTVEDYFSKPHGAEDVVLQCSLAEDAESFKTTLANLKSGTPRPRKVAVVIGPEGDFSDAETSAARSAGAVLVSLGELTLRADTAALYALSVLHYELGRGLLPEK